MSAGKHEALRVDFVAAISTTAAFANPLTDESRVQVYRLANRLVHLVVLHGLLPETQES